MPNLAITDATAVSDDGLTITGFGKSVFRIPAGDLRTEAWVAVPEPSATIRGAVALSLVFIRKALG